MTNVLNCEWMKLKKSTSFKILLLSMTAVGVAMVVFGVSVKLTGWDALMGSLGDGSLYAVIGSVMAGLFVCGDFENRTIQESIMCGNSHRSIFAGKMIVYLISIFVICLPFILITTVALSWKNGFGVPLTTDLPFRLAEMTIAVSFAYVSLLMLCLLISFTAQKTGASIGINVIAVSLGGSLINGIKGYLGPVGNIISYTPFGLYELVLQPNATGMDYLKTILVSCLWIALLSLVTVRLFYKKELK